MLREHPHLTAGGQNDDEVALALCGDAVWCSAVKGRTRRMIPKVIHSQRTRPWCTRRRTKERLRHMTMARMQTTRPMMPTPSTRTETRSMFV